MKTSLVLALTVAAFPAWILDFGFCRQDAGATEEVRAELIDGRVRTGRLADATDTGTLRLTTSDGAVTIGTAEVLVLTLRPEAPYRPPDPGVVLRCGDRLAGRVGVTDAGRVTVHTALVGEVTLRLDDVSALVFAPPSGDEADGREAPGVVLANGSYVAGPLRWLNATSLAIDSTVLGLVEVARRRVRRCVLAPVARRPAAERRAEVRLTNGDVLTGRLVHLGARRVVLETPWLGRRPIPTDRVQRVRFLGGRVTPLTDVKPVETKAVPFFDSVRSPRLGTSVGGRPMRIGRRSYVTGWGVQSRTELTFRLDGRYDALRADVGIDEEVGSGGSVVFLVELDGKVAYRSEQITGAMEAVPIRVKVSGAKVMRLIVEFADDAHVRDHADWAEPVLITAE